MNPFYRRESIARADQGNDLYSAVRNPHAPQRPRVIGPLDRMESQNERLERQQMGQIQNGYLRIMRADGSAIKLAALLAKFSFFTLVMPPYLALYIMPKALVTQLIPAIFQKFKDQAENAAAMIAGAGQWVQTNLLSALIKPFSAAKQHLQDFLTLMKHPSQMGRKVIGQLAKIPAAVIKPFKTPFNRSLLILKDIIGGMEFSAKLAAKASHKAKNKVAGIVQKGIDHTAATLQPIMQPVINWMANTYQATSQTVKDTGQRVINTLYRAAEKVTQRLMPPIQKAAKAARKAAKKLVRVAKPILDWGKSKVSKTIAKAKAAGAKIQEKAAAARDAVLPQMQAAAQHIKGILIPLFNPFVDAAKGSINLMAAIPVMRLMQSGIKMGGRWGERGKGVYEGVKKGVTYAASAIANAIIKAYRKWHVHLAKWLAHAWAFIKSLPAKARRAIVWSSKKVVAGIKKTGYFVVQTAHWSKLLLRFGMQLVRELKDELAYWLAKGK